MRRNRWAALIALVTTAAAARAASNALDRLTPPGGPPVRIDAKGFVTDGSHPKRPDDSTRYGW